MTRTSVIPRVLHLIDTGGPGGAETVFASLAEHGRKLGINAAVVVPHEGWLTTRLRRTGIDPVIVPSKNENPLRLSYRLASIAIDSGANMILAHLLGASCYSALLGLALRVPTMATFHGPTDLKGRGSFVRTKRWLLCQPHVTPIAVSEAVKSSLMEWGLSNSRIRLILNGVDTGLFAPVGSGNLHAELGLPPGTPIVGAVGNIRPAKSYDVLIEAARHVLAESPHVHFVIAGSGGEAELALLRSKAERFRIERNVHFLGFRSSSSDLYRSFTVMVSSSSTEGLPLSFLEALSCEVPLAATANEGASGLIGATKAGLLSPVGDAQALAESIRTLIKDPTLAASLARNGRIAIIERFSIQRTLAQYRDLFTEIQRT